MFLLATNIHAAVKQECLHLGPFHVLYLTYYFVYQFYSRMIVLVQS